MSFSISFEILGTKETAQAIGGDHLGVIWSENEDQNIWRMPQQLNAMSNIQLTRTATGYGNAEGGFFISQKELKEVFGLSRDISFGIYFNNSNVDFNRVNDNDTVGGHQVSP